MSSAPQEKAAPSGGVSEALAELLRLAEERGLVDEATAAALLALQREREAAAAAPAVAAAVVVPIEEVARRRRALARAEEDERRAAALHALREERQRRREQEAAQRQQRAAERVEEGSLYAAVRDPGAGAAPEDDERDAEVLPLLYENLGWLVGALLVITGSIYGLREAWATFDAAGRYTSVAAALFVYQTLFTLFGALLARRSRRGGHFLTAIGVCLVPLAFVSTAKLLALGGGHGRALLVAGLLTVGCAGSLLAAARRFGSAAGWQRALLVPAVLGPSLLLLASPQLEAAAALRFLLPLLALGAPLLLTLTASTSPGAFVLALYAALATEVFALTSDAADASSAALLWRTGGVTFGAWLGAYLTGLGLLLWTAPRLRAASEAVQRALRAVALFGTALSLGTALFSSLARLSTTEVPGALALQLSLAVALVASLQTLTLSPRRRGLLGLLVMTSFAAALACRLLLPETADARYWLAAMLAPPLVHLFGRGQARLAALGWAALLLLLLFRSEPRAGLLPLSAAAALLLALACHAQRQPLWHYAAAASAALLAAATWGSAELRLPALCVVVLAALYLGAARLWRAERAALDDASLGLLPLAALLAGRAFLAPPAFVLWPTLDRGAFVAALWSTAPLLAAAGLLLLRGLPDHSGLPPLLGALGLALAVWVASGAATAGAAALLLGGMALAAVLLAALLTPRARPAVLGRSVFPPWDLELPLGAAGRGAIAAGFGLAGLVLAVLAVLADISWLMGSAGGLRAAGRELAILGGLAVALTLVLGFATRAWQGAAVVDLRGRCAVLWLLALTAALTAVINRIGRPLPPEVVARNLTLIGAALWLVSRGVARIGPWLAEALEAPEEEGPRYAQVPAFGCLALGALLVVDAWLLTPLPLYRGLLVVPPLMLLGPALHAALLGRSLRSRASLLVVLPLLALGAALWGAQGRALGPALVALRPPGGAWAPVATASLAGSPFVAARYVGSVAAEALLYGHALVGAAALAALLALLNLVTRVFTPLADDCTWVLWKRRDAASVAYLRTAAVAAAAALLGGVASLGWFTSHPAAAGLSGVAGLLIAASAPRRALFVLPLLLALAYGVHTAAQLAPLVPLWAGPALGGLALLVAVVAHRLLKVARDPGLHLFQSHAVASSLGGLGIVYALASRGANAELQEGAQVVQSALGGVLAWGSSRDPVLALLLVGAAALWAALSWNALALRAPTRAALLAAAGLWSLAGATTAVWLLQARGGAVGPVAALGVLAVLVLCHAAARALQAWEEGLDLIDALRWVRDLGVLVTALLLATGCRVGLLPLTLRAGLVEAACVFVVALHAIALQRRAFHVYVAQSALLALYGLLRLGLWPTMAPEHDAIAFLGYGFVLIAVTALAQRQRAPEVAAATRRFTAVLPLLLALLLPWRATTEGALAAAGSGVLYAALGLVARSRLFGTFGAVAANVAFLVLALSQGLQGFDVYMLPLGLFVLIVGHLYAGALDKGARRGLRAFGTLLTFAPSGLAIVLQVGNARSDGYPLGFAVACLVAMAVGMWFHVRAYLVLGLCFLVLDLAAMLVRASLADQRLGFVVLSLLGLAILGLMATYTLRKEQVLRALWRVRRVLSTWD